MTDQCVGFIGLGLLGMPVATNLIDSGRTLRVFNRTASKAEPLIARGATLAATPAEVIDPGGVVISLVWDDAALASIIESEQFLERLGPGGVHVSMSTVSPETALRMSELHAAHGSSYVEAPVFGRPEAAQARKLWLPIAGSAAAKQRVRPLLEALGAQGIFDFGEVIGCASAVKLAGNFLIISAGHSLREALRVAGSSGADPKAVLEMLTSTLFPAPIYQSYGKAIVDNVPVLQSNIPAKDLGLFTRAAEAGNTTAPIASHLRELLAGRS